MYTTSDLALAIRTADEHAVGLEVELERALYTAEKLERPEQHIKDLRTLYEEARTLSVKVRAAQLRIADPIEQG